MINGEFKEKGQLFFELSLVSSDGLEFWVDGLFDTGFVGYIALNKQDVESLEWSWIDTEILRTAQGESTFDLYEGQAILDGQLFTIPIYAGENLQEILLGIGWLNHFDLMAQYRQNHLTLTP